MIARDGAATGSGRFAVVDDRPARTRIVRHANIAGTFEDTGNFGFVGADVRAVAASGICHSRIINGARHAALIKCGSSRDAGVNCGTPGCQGHRLSWAPITGQRH